MKETKTIGIVGCGWLGKPLAKKLSNTLHVECFSRETTTDDSLFWQSDTLIIAINTKDNYLNTLKKITSLTKSTCNIILMSSISVYREFDREVDEYMDITNQGVQKEAEDLVTKAKENVLVLRLGGLMGDDRISGRWKSVSSFSDGFVNYIHRDDVINIVELMIEKDIKKGIYNLVAPNYPLRSEVHRKNSKDFGFTLGTFEGVTKRKVLSNKLIQELGYKFLHPNPLDFWS